MAVTDCFGVTVTEDRWKGVDDVIRGFVRAYPLHFQMFKKDLLDNQTQYQLANEGDLKTAGWRNTMSLPVIYRRKTKEEKELDPHAEDDGVVEVDSLYKRLDILLPGLIEKDKPGKPNMLYKEFLRRYPIFRPGDKY